MGLSLNEAQFALFIQHLQNQVGAPLSIRKAVSIIGLQACGHEWVFGSDIQVSNNKLLRMQNFFCAKIFQKFVMCLE